MLKDLVPNVSPFRQDFLRLEKSWLELARSIEFGESLDIAKPNLSGANISNPPSLAVRNLGGSTMLYFFRCLDAALRLR
jgi:hypothetical protein